MLKLIAAFLMVLDHFAVVFLPSDTLIYTLFRLVGRLSMPLFAYYLAFGFIHTKHFNRYVLRLLVMTIFTQIPFTWMIYSDSFMVNLIASNGLILLEHFNIGFTFVCSLLVLKLLSTKNHMLLSLPFILILLYLSQRGDYGVYGISLVVLFYYYHQNKYSLLSCSLISILLTAIYTYTGNAYYWMNGFLLQFPACLSPILIERYHTKPFKLPKLFFYWFYPLHMLLLVVIASLL